MSDQTNPGDPGEAGDFRGSAADKRKDETVMVNADDLSNLVSNARQEPAPVAPPVAPAAESSSSRTLVIGVVGVIIILLLIAIVFLAR